MFHPIVPSTRWCPTLPVLCVKWKPAAMYLVCEGRQGIQPGNWRWTTD